MGVIDKRSKGVTDVWLTPPPLLKRLGQFDLDPSAPIDRPWDTAKKHYTIIDDGLTKDWAGRVWLNPPYGKRLPEWMERMRLHNNGLALTPCRTDTEWFLASVWGGANAVLFLSGRIKFFRPDGTQGSSASYASCLIAYGDLNVVSLENAGLAGYIVKVRPKNRINCGNKNTAGIYDSFQCGLPLPDGLPTNAGCHLKSETDNRA